MKKKQNVSEMKKKTSFKESVKRLLTNIKAKLKNKKILIAIISIITVLVAGIITLCAVLNKPDTPLHILQSEISLPTSVRTFENIGFKSETNSTYDLKEGEDNVPFEGIKYSYIKEYSSNVDPKDVPANDGMNVILDFVKTNKTRTISKMIFIAKENNGEYIAFKGLYMKDMTFDSIVNAFGKKYKVISGKVPINLFTKTDIQYDFGKYTVDFVFFANKISEFTITIKA